MGEILNIRVIAQTLDEEDMARAWPGICSLVWPEWMTSLNLRERRFDKLVTHSLGPSLVEKALGPRKRGVVELAKGLEDMVNFGGLPENTASNLKAATDRVAAANAGLAAALADWDPKKANRLSVELEAALDQAEKDLEKINVV